MADRICVNTDLLGNWSKRCVDISEDVSSIRGMLASLDTSDEWWRDLKGVKCDFSLHDSGLHASGNAAAAVKTIQGAMTEYARALEATASSLIKAKHCFEDVENRMVNAFCSLEDGLHANTSGYTENPFEGIQPSYGKPAPLPIPGFSPERAFYFSTFANEAYRMKENGVGSTDNRWEIADDNRSNFGNAKNPITEALVMTSLTMDGELVLTISFEGSQDLFDDWMRDTFGAARNGVHVGVETAMRRFIRDYVNNENQGMNVSLKNEYGEIEGRYTLKQLLDEVKNNPNARLCISGHSLGGGMAQYFTYYAIEEMGIAVDQVETYTFASLVPFTDEFVQKHPRLSEANIYNVIDKRDIVPDVGVTDEKNVMIKPGDGISEIFQAGWNHATSLYENGKVFADYTTGEIREGGYNESGSNIGTNVYMDSGKSDLKNDRNPVEALTKKHGMDHYQYMISHPEKYPYNSKNTLDIISRKQRRT